VPAYRDSDQFQTAPLWERGLPKPGNVVSVKSYDARAVNALDAAEAAASKPNALDAAAAKPTRVAAAQPSAPNALDAAEAQSAAPARNTGGGRGADFEGAKRLWIQAGGDPKDADIMAHVAGAESGYNTNAVGPNYQDGGKTYHAEGDWQISKPASSRRPCKASSANMESRSGRGRKSRPT